ncbi:peptidase S41 family protein-like protein [Plenodomus tracheiphilus IPT5]|uniref:Peptidase S41 family protein-like protein n=1 Tax=Plenodomus tracheiphilus IPT5 TaxID=1408161 RepID=A0A6A7BC03_9PLEO|nr:peptidase S41 family protein-like protein [Plenodomus tracheiphilus IPT5]
MRSSTCSLGLIAVVAAQSSLPDLSGPSQTIDLDPTQIPTSIGNVEPTATESLTSGPIESGTACAQVSDLISDDDQEYPVVAAELAYACLRSVPIVEADAALTIEAIKKMAEFQSTITYLKDPPKGWPNEAVDIIAGLDDIGRKVNGSEYSNEYDFETDIASLFVKAHDGHLNWNGMAYSAAFQWRRNSRFALISASTNGSDVPKVWAFQDFNKTGISYDPSPVTQINGKDVVQFLQEEASLNSYHDPDARYNAMFLMQPAENYGYFTNPRFYPGPSTNIKFENGTESTSPNFAVVLQPSTWEYIDSPESFYETYVIPETSSTRVKKRDPNALPMHLENPRDHEFRGTFALQHGSVPEAYPTPEISHSAELVPLAGYFLNLGGQEVGVLVVQTFNTEDAEGAQEFQQVVQEYISQAKSRGVEKHIIDIRANGGGKILSGYDMYTQFFPSQKPQTQSRYRGHTTSELFGRSISSFKSMTVLNAELYTSPFSNDAYVSSELQEFSDWDAMYPPEEFHNDKFTALLKYNLSDPVTTSNERLAVGITVTGYGDRSNFTQDPFRPEDIILLSDGVCASTCSIFVELMSQQSGVRTLAVGGRPQLGAMQAVGGTKGTLVLPSVYLQALSVYIISQFANTNAQAREWAAFVPNPFAVAAQDASVNFQDNIRAGLESGGLPTQFLNDTAGCRIWYEPDMYLNVTRLWEKTAKVAFGNNGGLDEGACVSGSVTSREEQTGRGEGNPTSSNGNAQSGSDEEDAAGVVRPAWTAILVCAVVVVASAALV